MARTNSMSQENKLKQENKICRYMQTRTQTDQVSKGRT